MTLPRDLSGVSDRQLVGWALQGHERAYSELLSRYQRTVLQLIYRIVRNRQRAEELTQVTLIKAFEKIASFDTERKFEPWLLEIARNTAFDALKRKRVDSLSSGEALPPEVLDVIGIHVSAPSDTKTPNPDAGRVAAEVDEALDRLRPQYREAFVLRVYEKRSYDDIAEIMDIPRGTVGTFLHRARKQLREILPHLRDSA